MMLAFVCKQEILNKLKTPLKVNGNLKPQVILRFTDYEYLRAAVWPMSNNTNNFYNCKKTRRLS